MEDDRILSRDVEATLIPQGEPFVLEKGTEVVITHRLGGNFTVMTANGMFRISRKNADALGETVEEEPVAETPAKKKGTSTEEPDIEEIWAELKGVFDPEIPVNIVDLGLVYSVELQKKDNKNHVQVMMSLTAPGCGMGPVIAEDARLRLIEIEGIESADVEIVWDPPWHQDMISEEGKMELGLI